ncbi:MAG: hypothetical protein COA58_05215 [Bacteroidetes bacterium]|nr:MAG: hypothetical protein COA58_05215 [Bacteroidota bacterium]
MSTSKPQVIDAKTLLKIVGGIALLLPFVLLAFAFLLKDTEVFRPSISDYFYSKVNVVFIGCMCSVSMFFFAYIGYDLDDDEKSSGRFLGRLHDRDLATIIAVLSAFVAIFPTTPLYPDSADKIIAGVHFTSAALFLLLLAYMSINRFTKTSKNSNYVTTGKKRSRNKWYKILGWVMVASVLVMAAFFVFTGEGQFTHVVFIGETVCLLAFGTAWVIKGELFLKDDE